jgi:5-methylcytosine-specific restriction endonuclease McrA
MTAAERWAALSVEQKAEIYKKRKEYYAKTTIARSAERKRSYDKLKESPQYMEDRRLYTNERRALNGRKPELSNPEVKRRYRQTAKGKVSRSKDEVARRTGLKQATPIWANVVDIGDVYLEAAHMQMQVDHIVPLQNNLVCGLHTWDNLQLLTPLANNLKGNRHWPDMPL